MDTHPETLFWDVDTQVDFMQPNGALYVPGAEEIVPALERLTQAARRFGLPVVMSADDHETTDAEISDAPDFATTYPAHCMRGTPGRQRIAATRRPEALVLGHRELPVAELRRRLAAAGDAVLLLKKTVDVFSNPNTENVVRALSPRRIVVYGVALDVCNERAVEGLWRRGYHRLTVVTDATRALDVEKGRALLDDWKARGIELATSDEVVARLEARVQARRQRRLHTPMQPPAPRQMPAG
jgi:nicotinamidase/pyrazinamidase